MRTDCAARACCGWSAGSIVEWTDEPAARAAEGARGGAVDRRVAGGTIIVLLLVAVFCAPGIAGRSVSGAAVPAVAVDPRPTPGDCLGVLQNPSQLYSIFDVVPVVPCAEPHSAEVVAVGTLDPTLWKRRPEITDSAFTSGSLSQHCDQMAVRYIDYGDK